MKLLPPKSPKVLTSTLLNQTWAEPTILNELYQYCQEAWVKLNLNLHVYILTFLNERKSKINPNLCTQLF